MLGIKAPETVGALQTFNYENNEIRIVTIDGAPWFVGKDVASILGYERPTKAVQSRVDNEDKDEVLIRDSIGRMQNTPIINESGLYRLILSSKLSTIKAFKRWVTSNTVCMLEKSFWPGSKVDVNKTLR